MVITKLWQVASLAWLSILSLDSPSPQFVTKTLEVTLLKLKACGEPLSRLMKVTTLSAVVQVDKESKTWALELRLVTPTV
jgi:hypothetical protein